MIEIKLDEPSKIVLEMNIEGSVKDSRPELRFSVLAEGVRYGFEGIETQKGIYEIAVPKLLGRINEGRYDAEVEIIVDGKYFAPLNETVQFVKEVKPIVSLKETMAKLDESRPSVRVQSVSTSSAEPQPIAFTVPEETFTKKIVVNDVRGLLMGLSEIDNFDSGFALACMEALATGSPFKQHGFEIKPKKALSENEAIAALRVIRTHGSDIEGDFLCETIAAMSPKVSDELRAMLAEKGVSARVLKERGL